MTLDVKTLIETSLQAEIVKAFHEAPEAIDKLVMAALESPVDQWGGKPDKYSSRGTMPYLQWLVGDTIRRIARAAVIETIEKRESEIREAVQRAVSADAIVDGLMEKILGTLKQDYKINVSFADEKEDDY